MVVALAFTLVGMRARAALGSRVRSPSILKLFYPALFTLGVSLTVGALWLKRNWR
jgi:hypothetical protein